MSSLGARFNVGQLNSSEVMQPRPWPIAKLAAPVESSLRAELLLGRTPTACTGFSAEEGPAADRES